MALKSRRDTAFGGKEEEGPVLSKSRRNRGCLQIGPFTFKEDQQ